MKRTEVLAALNRAMTASDEELRIIVADAAEQKALDGAISKLQLLSITLCEVPSINFAYLKEPRIC